MAGSESSPGTDWEHPAGAGPWHHGAFRAHVAETSSSKLLLPAAVSLWARLLPCPRRWGQEWLTVNLPNRCSSQSAKWYKLTHISLVQLYAVLKSAELRGCFVSCAVVPITGTVSDGVYPSFSHLLPPLSEPSESLCNFRLFAGFNECLWCSHSVLAALWINALSDLLSPERWIDR